MFSNKFSKILSVGSSVVISAGSVTNINASAEEFNWWLLFLYFFGMGTHCGYFNNPSERKSINSCTRNQNYIVKLVGESENIGTVNTRNNAALEPRKDKISVNSLNLGAENNSKAKQPLNPSRSNGNSLENSEGKDITSFGSIVQEASEKSEETKKAFSSINNKLEKLYKRKEELEMEVEKEKKSSKKYYEYFPVKSDLIEVCEEIGRIEAKLSFFRQCVRCKKIRFLKNYCANTANNSCTRQRNIEGEILSKGVVVFPKSEGYSEGFKNTDLLINVTWQLESCRLNLKFVKDEIDEEKVIDIKNKEDLISNSVPFSSIAMSAIDYFKDSSKKQDACL